MPAVPTNVTENSCRHLTWTLFSTLSLFVLRSMEIYTSLKIENNTYFI